MIVVSPVQMAQLRKNPPEETERAVLIESDLRKGFVLIRALQGNQAQAPAVERFLSQAKCGRYALPDANADS